MATQANLGISIPSNAPIIAFGARDFARINSLKFYNLRVDEDPHEFIDEVYKVLKIMGVSSKEKVELVAYN